MPERGRSLHELEQAWHQTGLRNDDFRDALRLLLHRGLLALQPVDGSNYVVLTAAGSARLLAAAYRLPTAEEDLEDLRSLRQARRRTEAGARDWSGGERRADESAPLVHRSTPNHARPRC
ncbi:hypothetical protein E4T66_03050 [Sinimarinibacterium sp. CAU 1509]|uniref:hypothetical protein n=1 Tax=Sinimarinibacterium sp. CAU 1509 TaxID=2562283 RepID=UPI0010ABFD33|nr:hypothetical protein [Sinimarinibacterium sp. CAU 1509]TJY65215.1 hypothetical protein E4T66_03050 [Sinimarinibacterium sp. CAU 1509]